jgi:hypothetical protein
VAHATTLTAAEDSAPLTGWVVATDVDAAGALTYALNGAAPVGLVFNTDGSYSFDLSNAAYQSLGVGQSATADRALHGPLTIKVRPRRPTWSSPSPARTTRRSRKRRASRSPKIADRQRLGQRHRCRCERHAGFA